MKHWPILIICGTQHYENLNINDCDFVHLTLILLLHYLVKYTEIVFWRFTNYSSEYILQG